MKKWIVIIGIVLCALIWTNIEGIGDSGEVESAGEEEVIQFMEDMKKGIEGEIQVAWYYPGGQSSLASNAPKQAKGWVIYKLQSFYDEATKQSWIQVTSDLSRFKQSPDEPAEIIPSQQCGYIRYKSMEELTSSAKPREGESPGYMLTECFHRWEYMLM